MAADETVRRSLLNRRHAQKPEILRCDHYYAGAKKYLLCWCQEIFLFARNLWRGAAHEIILISTSVAGTLFGVTVTDPAVIAIASSTFSAVTTIAGFLPARRASRVDPMIALRAE